MGQGITFQMDDWDFKSESILTSLPQQETEKLARHQSVFQFNKGDSIFREGGFPAGIFFIREGKIKKFKTDKDGKEHVIYIAGNGELMGYHAVLSNEPYPDSATAIEKSQVIFIPKEDFLEVLQESDILGKRLLKILSHDYAVLANNIATYAHKPVKERLALQLAVLCEKYKTVPGSNAPVSINISRDDLASLVGTARENVVRLLSALKAENILETKGSKIVIHNIGQLLAIAGC
ncbi:MAG: Crp/Fnr family transcriptional regulator [Ferruginibacter sp.]